MTFIRYPHLERFGNSGVQDIEFGVTHVFPKLDGTNASVWYEGTHDGECDSTLILGAGSRNRPLETEKDNAGFCNVLVKDNGPGFDIEQENKGLGIKIIKTLLAQLDGSYGVSIENGVKYNIQFKMVF